MSFNYVQYVVYTNLYKYFEFRGLTPLDPMMSEIALKNLFQRDVYVKLAARQDEDVLLILFFDKTSQMKPAELKKVIEQQSKFTQVKTIMILTYEEIKKIFEINFAKIMFCSYNVFKEYHPESIHFPIKCEIIPSKNVRSFMEDLRIHEDWTGKIHSGPYAEPMVVWYNLQPGQICAITTICESTGFNLQYYKIIKTPS